MEMSPSTYETVTNQYEVHPAARLGLQVAANAMCREVTVEAVESSVYVPQQELDDLNESQVQAA